MEVSAPIAFLIDDPETEEIIRLLARAMNRMAAADVIREACLHELERNREAVAVSLFVEKMKDARWLPGPSRQRWRRPTTSKPTTRRSGARLA